MVLSPCGHVLGLSGGSLLPMELAHGGRRANAVPSSIVLLWFPPHGCSGLPRPRGDAQSASLGPADRAPGGYRRQLPVRRVRVGGRPPPARGDDGTHGGGG